MLESPFPENEPEMEGKEQKRNTQAGQPFSRAGLHGDRWEGAVPGTIGRNRKGVLQKQKQPS